ncbi:type I-E CRISPR-associated endoribonuclease Cas2e [Levilactobacillus yonginensis]|uniref:type I-E CRISPR-associated endoribonuclease Cas2e n=1 Tax=Levilactobacillus yonginensis TaxID=1054041 RepID=UPI000F79D070|nr:type I-E CRISPR-associated endoribonuclease Cas2e [Levilactobacillus yonginensis]
MIVITLTKVPRSLRGDLTKWYQEIQTGVYVGSVSARVRDALWDRIMENIGRGEATMVYNSNNELGYQFRTTRQNWQVVEFDGIPLMKHLTESTGSVKHGFSNAAKFHKAKVMTQKSINRRPTSASKLVAVSIDLETTGLDPTKDEIISIGAVKRGKDNQITKFYQLIQTDEVLPQKIVTLTGITDGMLASQGVSLKDGLKGLRAFIADFEVVGYNLRFDETFLTVGFRKIKEPDLTNRMIDLMPLVKKANKFLDNYRLDTGLDEYDVENQQPHNSFSDAQATLELATKLKEKGTF